MIPYFTIRLHCYEWIDAKGVGPTHVYDAEYRIAYDKVASTIAEMTANAGKHARHIARIEVELEA